MYIAISEIKYDFFYSNCNFKSHTYLFLFLFLIFLKSIHIVRMGKKLIFLLE